MILRAFHGPALRGGLLALAAAVLFGVSTPLVQRLGVDIGSLTTAALLYAGATFVGAMMRRPVSREAQVQGRDAGRLAVMALFGAAIGPVALAWGLQHNERHECVADADVGGCLHGRPRAALVR